MMTETPFASAAGPSLPEDPDILAKAALLVDAETGAIAYGINGLAGEIMLQNVLKTYLGADRITVGIVVPMDDNGVILLNLA